MIAAFRFTATYNFFVIAAIGLVFKVDYFRLGNDSLGSLSGYHARPPLYVVMVYRYTNCIILCLKMDKVVFAIHIKIAVACVLRN